MDKLEKEDVYVAKEQQTAPDTNDLTLKGPPVRQGGVVRITAMYVIDRTSDKRTLRLGYEKAGAAVWFKRKKTGTSEFSIAQNGRLVLVAGERPCAMIENPNTNDDCALIVRGEYM